MSRDTPGTWRSFSARESDEADVVIIGSGIAGLSTAALLTRNGKHVMVLEQHEVPGGAMHHFKLGGEWVAIGWHAVGELPFEQRLIFDEVTDNQPLDFEEGCVTDILHGHGSLSKATFQAEMGIPISAFNRLMGYFFLYPFFKILPWPLAALMWLWYKITGRHREATMNYEAWCKKQSGESTPRKMWWIQQGGHGMPKAKTGAILQASVVGHYYPGISHPRGGTSEVARRACAKLKRKGCQVLVRAPVEEIIVSNNQVEGIIVDGTRIKCKTVVVSGVLAMKKLLKNPPSEIRYAASLGPSVGHGFIFWSYAGKTAADLDLPEFEGIYHFDTEKPLSLTYQQSPTGIVVQMLYCGMSYPARGPGYEEAKEEMVESISKTVFEAFPKLRHYDAMDAATTTEKFLWAQGGGSLGLDLDPRRFSEFRMVRALSPATSVKGLFLTGQDMLLAGVISAMMSGVLTTQAILYPGLRGLFHTVMGPIIAEAQAKKKKEREENKKKK